MVKVINNPSRVAPEPAEGVAVVDIYGDVFLCCRVSDDYSTGGLRWIAIDTEHSHANRRSDEPAAPIPNSTEVDLEVHVKYKRG